MTCFYILSRVFFFFFTGRRKNILAVIKQVVELNIVFLWQIFNVISRHRRGFLCGSAGKESILNEGDLSLIPGLGRSPGEGNGYLLQDSGLENSMDCIVHVVAISWAWQSNFHFQNIEICYSEHSYSDKKWM